MTIPIFHRRTFSIYPYDRDMSTPPDPHERRPEEQHPCPQLEQQVDKLERKRRELEAEVERLREALEEISEKAFPCPGPDYIAHIQVLKSTADEVLDGAEGGQS